MSFSSTSFIVGISTIAALTLGACKSTYSDVYSNRKNSFIAPVKPAMIVPPTVIPADVLGGAAPVEQPMGGIPGVDAGGIPGVPAADPIPMVPPVSVVPGL